MSFQIKVLVCVLPYILAIVVGFMLLSPAYGEFSDKAKQLEDKKAEQTDLQGKLADSSRLLKEQAALKARIEELRGSVPKRPDMEILVLDIEKMSNDAGVDLISFGTPDKDTLKKAGLADEPKKEEPKKKKKDDTSSASAPSPEGDVGLSKVALSVKCIGDYTSVQKFLRELETYRRVVAISQVKIFVPKKSGGEKGGLPDESTPTEGEDQGDFHRLWCNVLITAYYLP